MSHKRVQKKIQFLYSSYIIHSLPTQFHVNNILNKKEVPLNHSKLFNTIQMTCQD